MAFFDGTIAYDDHYTGLAADLSEGERLSQLMSGGKTVLFMESHAIVTTITRSRLQYVLRTIMPLALGHLKTTSPNDLESDDERL